MLPWLALFAGCGSSVTPEGFDTSCAADKDCIGVFTGDFCASTGCGCPNTAINASSKAAWESYATTGLAACTGPGSGMACSCANHPLTCESGTCTIN